ncbi:MAG: rhombosortase [Gammaproteobacteria bacterium]|nr:rhombosortase [Gammaproteobacteria bacterium]
MKNDAGTGARRGYGEITARHALPLALALLAVAAMIGGQELRPWLRYDRAAILEGEVWRLLSAHIAHLGWKHLAMNLVGLGLIWMLFGRFHTMLEWLAVTLFCMLGASLALLVLQPEVHWYVGLSGVLHGLFVAGALASLAAGYRAELLLLGLLLAKLVWEQMFGALPGSESFAGGTVLVDSHLYGAIAGLLAGAMLLMRTRRRGKAAD